jgi:hypothetical protein
MNDPTIDERPVDTRPIDTHLMQVQGQVTDVQNIMAQTINKTLDRGDRIQILVEKSTDLSNRANVFKSTTTNLKRRMLIRNLKLGILIALIVLIVIGFIILLICVSGSC